MKLNLTTWQRITLTQIIGGLQGPVALVRNAGKLLDILEMNQEEMELVGLNMLPGGNLRWQDTEKRWELEVKDGNLASFLCQHVKAFQDWPAVNHRAVMDLFEQLGIEG